MNKTILQNGLTIISEKNTSVRSVTLGYLIKVGSFHEANHKKGIAHLIEHMMFQGTTTRTNNDISEQMEDVGGVMNAYTTLEHTKYYCSLPYTVWREGFHLLSDMVWNSTFASEKLEKEKDVIYNEIKMDEDDHLSVLQEKFWERVYPSNPERYTPLGTQESVRDISKEDIETFLHEFYTPDNIIIVATGNIDHEDLVSLAKDLHVTRSNPSTRTLLSKVQPLTEDKEDLILRREVEQAQMVWMSEGPAKGTPDAAPMALLTYILGGSATSRLFRSVRNEKGLAYSVHMGLQAQNHVGWITGYAGTDPENINLVKETVKEQISALIEDGVNEKELNRAKASMVSQFAMGLESTRFLNNYLSTLALRSGTSEINAAYLDEEMDRYQKVTLKDLSRVAEKYLDPERFIFSQVLPNNT